MVANKSGSCSSNSSSSNSSSNSSSSCCSSCSSSGSGSDGDNRKRPAQNGNTNNVTARLLVLGDKQVGKSATIVRYTTGRFIQEYSSSTNDWLYKHQLGFDEKRNQTVQVELLEQRDIKFCNSGNFFSSSIQDKQNNQHTQTLASRVAHDQQLANELHEKQEMLNKIHWADAYIVIYAINEKSTFNKAIKYLNLIANNINSPVDANPSSCNHHGGNGTVHNSSGNIGTNFFNRLSPGNQTNGNGGNNKLSPNCNCNQTSSSNKIRRPILLLGNKRDLERSSRQVSTGDGRLLAMRHQSMFAEVSIAESNKLIESFLQNLVEQIDPVSLRPSLGIDRSCHQDLSGGQHHSSKHQALSKWKPTVEAVLGPSSIQLTAPIWGSLVRSKDFVSTMVAQSSLVSSGKLEVSDICSAAKPMKVLLAKSVQVENVERAKVDKCSSLIKSATGMKHASRISAIPPQPMPMRCTNLAGSAGAGTNNYQKKYRNLKSSFKRASMAIVSSKALASKSSKLVDNQKRSSTTSSDSIGEFSTTSGQSANIDYTQNDNLHNNCNSLTRKRDTLPPIKPPNAPISDKFRRPLFSYRNRRTTVAFEDIDTGLGKAGSQLAGRTNEKNSSGSQMNLLCQNQSKLVSQQAKNNDRETGYQLARDRSNRSSSSLSTADTYCSSSLVLCDLERPISSGTNGTRSTSAGSSNCSSQTANLTLRRHNSNTTLSYASTSGGSYEESGDELIAQNSINIKAHHYPHHQMVAQFQNGTESVGQLPPVSKKRYDLVKSVQSTFSNLTRSSNITSQPPKRSFCSTLFRQSNPNATTTVKKVIAPPSVGLAKTENIRPMPTMVGYCK